MIVESDSFVLFVSWLFKSILLKNVTCISLAAASTLYDSYMSVLSSGI